MVHILISSCFPCELNLGIARANSLLFELQETFKCSILFSMVNNLGLKLVYGCFIVLLIWCLLFISHVHGWALVNNGLKLISLCFTFPFQNFSCTCDFVWF